MILGEGGGGRGISVIAGNCVCGGVKLSVTSSSAVERERGGGVGCSFSSASVVQICVTRTSETHPDATTDTARPPSSILSLLLSLNLALPS